MQDATSMPIILDLLVECLSDIFRVPLIISAPPRGATR